MNAFRWAIFGSGQVARKFALGLRASKGSVAQVAASRSQERADAFARSLGIPSAIGGYAEAAASPDVDAVYIATPPSEHLANATLCLEAGKPVLLEKPFTLDADQARRLAEIARSRGVFCMEGMWTRFHPATQRMKQLAESGTIGTLRRFEAEFAIASAMDADSLQFQPAMGGGALMHRGVYPVSLAQLLLGPVREVQAHMRIGETGVDEDVAALLVHEGGALSQVGASMVTDTERPCELLGDAGSLRLWGPLYRPFGVGLRHYRGRPGGRGPGAGGGLRAKLGILKEGRFFQALNQRLQRLGVTPAGRGTRRQAAPYVGNGYQYQADEVMECVRAGRGESATMGLDDSIAVMEILDRIRAAAGGTAAPSRGPEASR